MRISIILGLVFTLWVLPGEVASQVYRHIDKNGVVLFTDTPTDRKFSHHQGSWIENKADNSREVTEAEDNNEEIGQKQKDVISSERQLPPPIKFASPPEVIVIPKTNVYVVPDLAVDFFFFDGWWWRPWEGRWYRSRNYRSGWGHYNGVPSFYGRVHSGWRDEYRKHRWNGREWHYQRVSHPELQQNWRRDVREQSRRQPQVRPQQARPQQPQVAKPQPQVRQQPQAKPQQARPQQQRSAPQHSQSPQGGSEGRK